MTEHNLFYYPCASFTDTQLPLLKVAALYFNKLVLHNPLGANGVTGPVTPCDCETRGRVEINRPR